MRQVPLNSRLCDFSICVWPSAQILRFTYSAKLWNGALYIVGMDFCSLCRYHIPLDLYLYVYAMVKFRPGHSFPPCSLSQVGRGCIPMHMHVCVCMQEACGAAERERDSISIYICMAAFSTVFSWNMDFSGVRIAFTI